MINIIQNGHDGLGHQLEGLFTCLVIHNIENYYFDGIQYIRKQFRYEHLNTIESDIAKEYSIEIVTKFIEEHGQKEKQYDSVIHSHEIYNIPKNYSTTILYSLDNVYSFQKLYYNTSWRSHIHKNIKLCEKYFMNDKLPKKRIQEKNIVIHIRLGDAIFYGRGDSIHSYTIQIKKLLDIFKIKYPDYNYYIHSDGDVTNIISDLSCTVFSKETPILDVISDLMYSDILVTGVSSLSKFCSFFGNKKLVITHDDNGNPITTENCFTISEYLENTSIMTLREWQSSFKRTDTLIVQASNMAGGDGWQVFPIGMGCQYILCNTEDRSLQIGDHEKLVFCGITDWTDGSRRPCGINRKAILNNLSSKSIHNTLLSGNEYFSSLPTYKFVISPEGNGIDCHRHYESLLAGSIPIIERNPLIEDKYKGCPILYTTDYSEINEEYLLQKYNEMLDKTYDFSRLFLSYYSPEQIQCIKQCGNHWTVQVTGKTWY